MSYLIFTEISDTGKTKKWEIRNKHGIQLGWVAWYSPWRRYCCSFVSTAILDATCLAEVSVFIQLEMDKRV